MRIFSMLQTAALQNTIRSTMHPFLQYIRVAYAVYVPTTARSCFKVQISQKSLKNKTIASQIEDGDGFLLFRVHFKF